MISAVDSAPAAAYRDRAVVVLGATGFIGRRVAARLEGIGAQVTRVVRPGTVPPPGAVDWARVEVVDLARPGSALELIARIRPSATFNLAAYGVSATQRDKALAIRLNQDLPAELAWAGVEYRHPGWPGLALVHAGSALEYGVAGGDLAESTAPRPTTDYGVSKLGGTLAVARACTEGTLRGVTARLFTVYGPGEPAGRLLPTLLQASRTSNRIALSPGAQRRDFTTVDDVVDGLLRLGCLPEISDPVVNLATGILTPVREFVTRAATVLGINPERLDFGALPERPEEMQHHPVNVDRLVRWTGWRPMTDIEAGVRQAAEAAGMEPQEN